MLTQPPEPMANLKIKTRLTPGFLFKLNYWGQILWQ
jgi:hypothetical protein